MKDVSYRNARAEEAKYWLRQELGGMLGIRGFTTEPSSRSGSAENASVVVHLAKDTNPPPTHHRNAPNGVHIEWRSYDPTVTLDRF